MKEMIENYWPLAAFLGATAFVLWGLILVIGPQPSFKLYRHCTTCIESSSDGGKTWKPVNDVRWVQAK